MITGNLDLVLHCFRDRATLMAENRHFSCPWHLTPSLWFNLIEFLDESYLAKTRVLGQSVSEDFVILIPWLASFCIIPAR